MARVIQLEEMERITSYVPGRFRPLATIYAWTGSLYPTQGNAQGEEKMRAYSAQRAGYVDLTGPTTRDGERGMRLKAINLGSSRPGHRPIVAGPSVQWTSGGNMGETPIPGAIIANVDVDVAVLPFVHSPELDVTPRSSEHGGEAWA